MYQWSSWKVRVKVKVTLRLMVSLSVSLGVEPHLGLMTRYLLLFDSFGLVFMGRHLWREEGSVFCICCWPSPAQSFSGPSSLDLATIFHCLGFETSLFVASYDSQGHAEASHYIASGRTTQKTHPFPSNGMSSLLRIHCCGMCLLNRCLATSLSVAIHRLILNPSFLFSHWIVSILI
jgi:hypothetical protein